MGESNRAWSARIARDIFGEVRGRASTAARELGQVARERARSVGTSLLREIQGAATRASTQDRLRQLGRDLRIQDRRRVPLAIEGPPGALVPYEPTQTTAPVIHLPQSTALAVIPPTSSEAVPISSNVVHSGSTRGIDGGAAGSSVSASAQTVPAPRAGRWISRAAMRAPSRVRVTSFRSLFPRSLAIPAGSIGPGIDEKYFDSIGGTFPQAFDPTTVVITQLDMIPRGNSVNQRTGKAWMPTSIQFQAKIFFNDPGVGNPYPSWADGLLMIIWDNSPMGSLPPAGTVLTEPAGNLASSFMNRDYQSRYKVLYTQRVFGVSGTSSFLPGPPFYMDPSAWMSLSENVLFPRGLYSEATAADTSGDIATRVQGALLLLTTGTVPTAVPPFTAGLGMQFNYRLNFHDC